MGTNMKRIKEMKNPKSRKKNPSNSKAQNSLNLNIF